MQLLFPGSFLWAGFFLFKKGIQEGGGESEKVSIKVVPPSQRYNLYANLNFSIVIVASFREADRGKSRIRACHLTAIREYGNPFGPLLAKGTACHTPLSGTPCTLRPYRT